MTRPKAPAPRIDWLIARVVHAARKWVATGAHVLRRDEERRHLTCLLVITGSDPIALGFYDECLRAGMSGPPTLNRQKVTTLSQAFGPVIGIAASHYDLSELALPQIAPGEVRVLVLTLGTLTIPEGFLLNAVFKTRPQGQRFMTNYLVQLAEVEASGPTTDAIERELLQFKPTYGGRDVPFEVQSRVYAQVGWLEKAKHLPDDRFNGLVFNYGCEMQLEQSGELARMLGGTRDDLN